MSHSKKFRASILAAFTALLILLPATGAFASNVKVVSGNTLSGIAASQCGRASAWPGIWHDNPQISNPDLIFPGQTLAVNCASPRGSNSASRSGPSGSWVHPIRAGLHGVAPGACWGAPRVGHTHKGVDLSAGYGVPIHAAHAGYVARISYDAGGAGWYVALNNGGGIWTVYEHMRSRPSLPTGARVAAGQTIGYVGATGNAKGPHLHFEVHSGALWHPINPAPFLRARGVNVGC